MGKGKIRRSKGKKKRGWGFRIILIASLFLLVGAIWILLIHRDGTLERAFKGGKKEGSKVEITPRRTREVIVFFCDPHVPLLVRVSKKVDASLPLEDQAREVITTLISGPSGGLLRTLPHGTELRGISVGSDGTATVDFSKELSRSHPGGSSAEIVTVYSIVNSLVMNFDQIKRVQILIEGKRIESLAGHISIHDPIEADEGLIRSRS